MNARTLANQAIHFPEGETDCESLFNYLNDMRAICMKHFKFGDKIFREHQESLINSLNEADRSRFDYYVLEMNEYQRNIKENM